MEISKLCGGAAAVMLACSPAVATVITLTPNADISTTPYVITFASGETLSFSDVSASTTAFEGAIGVATTGAAEVFSTAGAPAFFQTFATSLFPFQQDGVFASYATPAGVPYSVALGVVGFEYALADGIHYGVARIGGATVYSYTLQSAPGVSLGFSVPEPATWTMLLTGFGVVGIALRRRSRAPAHASA